MAYKTVTESPMFIVKQKMTGVDFISSLPDEVLHHILSFTPTKYCIRTSVLSKRWKTMWYGTSCISIDCCRTDLVIPVDKTLRSFLSPKIKSFDLSICYGVCASWINGWIELAMSRNVENLSLGIKAMYCLPDSFFVNSDLKKLHVKLSRFQPSSRRASLSSFDIVPKCTISWSSLRELTLNSCDLPDQSFAKIIVGCSMLETLILNLCRRLHHLDLSKSLHLRRVEIYFGLYSHTDADEIIAPQIHYLKLAGYFRPCSLKDVSSLTEVHYSLNDHASLYIDFDVDFDFVQDTVVKMLANLQHAKKLTIQGVILQILSLAKLCGVPFPEFKNEELIVETMLVQTVIPGITELLQNSANLKKITIYPMKCNAIADKQLDKYLKTKGLNPYECWSGFFPIVEATDSYFNGTGEDEKSEYVVSLMELVLRNSKNLEMIVLRLGGYLGRREYRNLPPLIPTAFQNKNDKAKEIFKSFKIIP